MPMGDAGDDFAEQVVRAAMDIAKDILRYIDGAGMPHTGWKSRYENEREAAREAAEAAFLAEEDEIAEPDATWLWAPNAKEADELSAFLERKGYEFERMRPRKSDGVVKVKLYHNDGALPIAEGGEYDPVDFDDPETAETLDAYSYSECMGHMAVLADAQAMKSALAAESENIAYVPGSPENCLFKFTTVQWDQDGSVLLDYLDRAGIATESWLCEIPASEMGLDSGAEDIPGVAVEFNARNAPHVQAAVSALMASGIRGLDSKRFPGFGKAMRDAQMKASRLYEEEGLGYETLTVHDPEAAQAVRGLLVGEGVACAAVERPGAGEWDLVVDRADAIASQWRIHQLAQEFEEPAKRAKREAEALSRKAEKSAPKKAKAGKGSEKVEAKTRSTKYSRQVRDTPAADEQAARKGAAAVNRSQRLGRAIDAPTVSPKRPKR